MAPLVSKLTPLMMSSCVAPATLRERRYSVTGASSLRRRVPTALFASSGVGRDFQCNADYRIE